MQLLYVHRSCIRSCIYHNEKRVLVSDVVCVDDMPQDKGRSAFLLVALYSHIEVICGRGEMPVVEKGRSRELTRCGVGRRWAKRVASRRHVVGSTCIVAFYSAEPFHPFVLPFLRLRR